MSIFWKVLNHLKSIRHIKRGVSCRRIHAPSRIKIERPNLVIVEGDVYFGPNFTLMNKGEFVIGKNTIFGPNVCVIDYNHDFKSNNSIPYSSINVVKPVRIGSHVWIGFGAIILPGVSIGDGAIVGAGSVVTKSVPACSIVAGNPAAVVSGRNVEAFNDMAKDDSFFYLRHKN